MEKVATLTSKAQRWQNNISRLVTSFLNILAISIIIPSFEPFPVLIAGQGIEEWIHSLILHSHATSLVPTNRNVPELMS
jgi:hypothetical protein